MKFEKVCMKDFIETLTEGELKNVLGGSSADSNTYGCTYYNYTDGGATRTFKMDQVQYSGCDPSGMCDELGYGVCIHVATNIVVCNICWHIVEDSILSIGNVDKETGEITKGEVFVCVLVVEYWRKNECWFV